MPTNSTTESKPMKAIKGAFPGCTFAAEGQTCDALAFVLVFTVTVYGEVPSASKSTNEGLIVQVTPEVAPLHPRVTLPEKLPLLVALSW
jgi:hypothetical protein